MNEKTSIDAAPADLGARLEQIVAEKDTADARHKEEWNQSLANDARQLSEYMATLERASYALKQFGLRPEVSDFLDRADIILVKENKLGWGFPMLRKVDGMVEVQLKSTSTCNPGQYFTLDLETEKGLPANVASGIYRGLKARWDGLEDVTPKLVMQRLQAQDYRDWVRFKD